MGAGVGKRAAGVNWTTAQRMAFAWLVTIPAAAVIAGVPVALVAGAGIGLAVGVIGGLIAGLVAARPSWLARKTPATDAGSRQAERFTWDWKSARNSGWRVGVRAGVRQGDWKLIWRSPLPEAVELYDIAKDPSEKNNLAAANPEKVATLRARANELAGQMEKPLMLVTEFDAMRKRLHMPPALPGEETSFNEE